MKRILPILLTAVLISCQDKTDQLSPNVISYPMNVGTQWTYDRQIIVKKFESEISTNIVSADTFDFFTKVWIDKDTVLKDKTVKMFKAQDIGYNFTSVEFNYIDNEGLKTYAYLHPSFDVFAKQLPHLKSAELLGIITDYEITYEDTPTLNIQLPLKSASTWTFRGPRDNFPLKIEKVVTGAENLKLIGQEFNCYKVTWIYSNEPAYNSVHVTDWLSNKGLIKRMVNYDRVLFQDESGVSFGYIENTYTITLKALKIE